MSILLIQVALLVALAVALAGRRVPLGVRGEWEWSRLTIGPDAADVAIAATAVAAYAGFAGWGMRALTRRCGPRREALWLAGLLGTAVAIQAVVQGGAPVSYGLTKWSLALYNPGSSGYYTVAKREIGDARRFLEEYPNWLERQTVPRLGAHPPGLFLVAHGLLRAMESRPDLARAVLGVTPGSVHAGFREIDRFEPLPRADRAAFALTGALTLLACAATVVPLYLLARSVLPAPWAWASAAPWPLVPSAILFQPTADTAFPFLSTTALALAAWATRGRPALAAAAGLVLAVGMMFTLAFLPIGLTVALVLATAPGLDRRRRCALIAITGAGFLGLSLASWAMTGANPFVVWWWNRQNHARFYRTFSRSYPAWVLVNPIELAIGLGLPATAWAVAGLTTLRVPRLAWAAPAVLALLSFGGLNLSEVARLWLPWMPTLLVAAGSGLGRLGGGPRDLVLTVALTGLQTLLLEATIQVVYPI